MSTLFIISLYNMGVGGSSNHSRFDSCQTMFIFAIDVFRVLSICQSLACDFYLQEDVHWWCRTTNGPPVDHQWTTSGPPSSQLVIHTVDHHLSAVQEDTWHPTSESQLGVCIKIFGMIKYIFHSKHWIVKIIHPQEWSFHSAAIFI
jgi:hypothetical protein